MPKICSDNLFIHGGGGWGGGPSGACPGGGLHGPPLKNEKQKKKKKKKGHQSKYQATSPIFCYFFSRKYHFLS